jgi:hypothetical protein
MQEVQPIKAMKHAAEFILNTHSLIVAEGQNFDTSPLLPPFFSFVAQCVTYFSELIDNVAGDPSCAIAVLFFYLTAFSCRRHESPLQLVSHSCSAAAFFLHAVFCAVSPVAAVCHIVQHTLPCLERVQLVRDPWAFGVLTLWLCVLLHFCLLMFSLSRYYESKNVVLELRKAGDVSVFGEDLWSAIGGLGRGLEHKTSRLRMLQENAGRMNGAFSNALRLSFRDIIATFRGATLVHEASLCLRVFSSPLILLNGDKSWLPFLPDLCLSIMDVCPGPVFECLADCMNTLGVDVFGPAAARSNALSVVCKAAADAACNDDLDTGAAAAKFLCRYFLAAAYQPSPFVNNASAVLDISVVIRQNFVDSAVAASDAHALGHYM